MSPRRPGTSRLIPARESLQVEFKSDRRGSLSDNDLVAALACLANAGGGELYLGVEDDGQVTGVHARRTRPDPLAAMVANRTTPRLSVACETITVDGTTVFCFRVPAGPGAVMRADGLYQRRQLRQDGTPECVPMQPHEIAHAGNGTVQSDYSGAAVAGATYPDLDPIERERLRQTIDKRPGADKTLLELSDQEFDQSLNLIRLVNGVVTPTVTGLLLIGRSIALTRFLPTHEVAIQLVRGTELAINRHERMPIVAAVDEIDKFYELQPSEPGEFPLGMQRFVFPVVDREAFREVVMNAFAHRDYRKLGTTRMSWGDREVEVTSPGGLVAGVTVNTILTAPPTSRNPTLVDSLKRLGLVERNARGVDRIFEGQVRYGRPLPDYSGTTDEFVVVRLDHGGADREFYRALVEVESTVLNGQRMSVPETLVLAALRQNRRHRLADLAGTLQTSAGRATTIVNHLAALQLVAPHGRTAARFYELGPVFMRHLAPQVAAAQPVTLSSGEQEQWILRFAHEHGRVTRADLVRGLSLTADQAKHLLRTMVDGGHLLPKGLKRGAHYVLPE